MPKPLTEHDVLLMLLALALFVGLARLFGDFAARARQPQVLGELLAGVVLGPSVLGLVSPAALHAAGRGAQILEPIAWLGIILLLALTGIESDFASLRRAGRTAFSTTIGGVIVPLGAGFLLGEVLPASLLGPSGSRLAFALFLALAMSISAVTVIAKVLVDLGQMRRTAAKIILTGGVFDETLGWILLALVSGLATATLPAHGGGPGLGGSGAQHVDLAEALVVLGKAAAFLLGAALFGRRLVNGVIRVVRDRARIDYAAFTATVVLALVFAGITEALGLHQILGAFVFGAIAGTVPRIDRESVEQLRTVVRGLLVPVFFLFAGLKVDLTQLRHTEILLVALAFIGVAIAGKLAGCTLGGLVSGLAWREALLIGVGMSARGSMELVVAVIGLSLGILSPAMFSVIVLLSVVTILVVPTALRFAFAKTPPSAEERARIEREIMDERSYTPGVRRVLVPILPNAPAEIGLEAARALARSKASASEPLEIVVLRLQAAANGALAPRRKSEERLFRETSAAPPVAVEEQAAPGQPAVTAIAEAVERGYQLLVVGAPAPKRTSILFGPLINRLIRTAPCDLFVVSSALAFDIERVKRIVVPFTAKETSRAAADFAITLASGLGASVVAVSVVRELAVDVSIGLDEIERRWENTTSAFHELKERADRLGVAFESHIRSAVLPAQMILRELAEPEVDFCILGVSDQSHRGTPFFGDTADLLLRHAPTPVGLLVVR